MEWIKIFPTPADARKRLTENKPQLLIVHGKRICIILREDKVFAIQDSCSHSGESLSKGNINYLGEVVCPWHGHRFNLRTGRESSERSTDLETYPVKEDDTGFYIGI
jgi:3-phenylpropionate/trans-cinnamate dioxygenase ferredoxin subunit